jgi:ABC-type cobalamin transport system permease subunit
MKKFQMILQERVKLLLFVLLSISLNSFSTNTKFYNISDTYGITSGEAFSICKDQYGFIWTSTKTGILRVTVLVAIVTAYCGPIMFIGLAVPHLCRAIFHTSDHRILMPATLLVGASLALVCNLIARMPGFEGALPVNSVTALVGAPVVASVLFRKRKGELEE